MKVHLSLRLLSLRSNRFRLLVAKRKKRGKRVKVLIVQLCLRVVPRCAALAMALVCLQLFNCSYARSTVSKEEIEGL